MRREVIQELEEIARELARRTPKMKPNLEKRWKDLDGVEWTQRCVDIDWEKDRPADTRWSIKSEY